MQYILSPQVALRGWSNIQYALVNSGDNSIISRLDKKEYNWLCSVIGKSSEQIDEEDSEFHHKLLKYVLSGIISLSNKQAELSPGQAYYKYECKYIKEAVWAITGRCNYKCRHCSVSAPDYRGQDIPIDNCKRLVNEFAKCGISAVTLIGGEPLVRKDFLQIVNILRERKIKLSQIFTNGSLITESLLDSLNELGINPVFRMSFDGMGVHSLQRGVPNAEKCFFEKMELLEKRGFRVVIDMCMNSRNIRVLSETVERLNQYKNINMLNITPTCEIGEWKKEADTEKLYPDDYYEGICSFLENYWNKSITMVINFYRLLFLVPGRKPVLLPKNFFLKKYGADSCACSSFEDTINISPNGYVSPCYVISDSDYVKANMPNAYAQPLVEILNKSSYIDFAAIKCSQVINGNLLCRECEYRLICGGGCRAIPICENGDILGADKTNCAFFKNGYYNRLIKIIENH